MENKLVVARLKKLRSDRTNLEARWEKIDRLIVPLEEGTFASTIRDENEKNWESRDVWDSTAPIGQERLVAMFYSGLLSGRWLGINARNKQVNQDVKAKTWLEDASDRMFDALMAGSNFPVEMASLILHWVNYGNGCLTESLILSDEDKWDGLDFNCRPPRSMYFEEDHRGHVLRSYTPLQWTAGQIVEKFRDPEDPLKPHKSIPENIIKAEQSADGFTQKFDLVYFIGPRKGAKPSTVGRRAAKLRMFEAKYVLEQSDGASGGAAITLGEEDGFEEMPVFVTRYWKAASSMWGFGPSHLVLPTVGLLNAFQEKIFEAAAKAVDPATLTTEWGLLSPLKLGPGEFTVVRSLEDVAPYESKARFDVSDALLERQQMMVRKYYREDDIMVDASPQKSATEYTDRATKLNKLFGPQVRRFQWECLRPVVQTTFNHMLREGQFDKMPDILQDPKMNPRLQIEFYGQFMRAIRDDEVVAIERLFAAKAAMTKMDPKSRAKYVLKDDQAIREMGERMASPAAMFRSEEEVTTLEKQETAVQQAAAQAEIGKTAAEGERAMAGAEEMRAGTMGGTRG